MKMNSIVETHDLWKSYPLGEHRVDALRGVEVAVQPGEFVLLLGPSGSGKSSLMHILGAMDRPTRGSVHLLGQEVGRLTARQQAALRLRSIGFVFQNFNLMPALTALENVALPLRLAGVPRREQQQRATALLDRVGLADRAGHLPRQLSGGQRQRVAIARALANDPALILADEPTGNLDSEAGRAVMALFGAMHREGRTIVMVSHNPELTDLADRVLSMRDGHLSELRRAG